MNGENRKSWKEFEEAVELIYRKFHKNASVKRDDKIMGKVSGQMRQIDVSVKHRLGITDLLLIVECKRHGRKIDVKEMEAFAAKKDDVGANMGIMVAERGFTKGARHLAEAKGIKVYRLRDTRRGDWPEEAVFKFFIEYSTLTLFGFKLIDDRNQSVEFPPGEILHLFDVKSPDKEVTMDDFLRGVWARNGSQEGEFCYEITSKGRNTPTDPLRDYKMQIGFRVETRRFARDASLQVLGLVGADNVTHTDSFRLVTQPGKNAVYYSTKDFWQKVKADFGMIVKTCNVVLPNETDNPKRIANRTMLSLLPILHLEVTASTEGTPMKLDFGQKNTST